MTVQWTTRPPVLRRPVMVAAFEGWNDAGNAASDAIRWLERRLDATECATIDAHEYVDFQASRPQVELVDGVVRELAWPEFRILAAEVPRAARDLLLVIGVEPNLGWRRFCTDVLDIARATGCDTVVTLGALLADQPHSRPVQVTGTVTDEAGAARIGLRPSRYEGPTGIVGVLHATARDAGFTTASLWASVPHYVAAPPNPMATRELLARVAALFDLPLELADLEIAAAAWERAVAEIVEADAEVAEYVHRLEQRYDLGLGEDDDEEEDDGLEGDSLDFEPDFEPDDGDVLEDEDHGDPSLGALTDDTLPSGETLAEDFERYLRDLKDEDDE